MSVSIIGAGSIGLLFAAYIRQSGTEVTLYTRTEKQAKRLETNGIVLSYANEEMHVSVKAKRLTSEEMFSDSIIIVTVKQHQMNKIIPILQKNSSRKTYLFVQNGMGHLSVIEKIRNGEILLGSIEHGAMKVNDNKVVHTGVGKTNIAFFTNKTEQLPSYIASWSGDRFPIYLQRDWYTMMAYKLIANAVINPLTAIFRISNGTLLSNQYYKKVMRHLFDEAVSVLELDEIKLWDYVVSICKQTASNQSSMFRDIQAERETEIDAISGYIIERANTLNIDVPYTRFVYNSIKGLEYENIRNEKKEGRQNVN